MTFKELSQLYHLNREIRLDRERLAKLRAAAAEPAGPNLSGMPRVSAGNRLERYAAEIADLEAIISAKLTQCIHERNRLERYIAGIPDSLTRQIFTLRFVNGLSWVQVALRIGGNTTPDGVRMTCKRYLENSEEK